MIILYTDGSCSGNPGPGGYGVVIVEDDKVINTIQCRCDNTTNNREEMKAIIWALENFGSPANRAALGFIPIVYSDSAYCVNSFTNWIHNWKANGWTRARGEKLENIDLIKRYDELTTQGYKIDLQKIQGHAGHEYNELADRLATGKIKANEREI